MLNVMLFYDCEPSYLSGFALSALMMICQSLRYTSIEVGAAMSTEQELQS
jgi:hypothetical protein